MTRLQSSNKTITVDVLESNSSPIADHDYYTIYTGVRQRWYKTGIDIFCGLEGKNSPAESAPSPTITDITEDKIPTLVVNLSCLLMLIAMIALFVWYR